MGFAEIFGKIMSIRDELIADYFDLCTDVSFEEIENIKAISNPRDQKVLLAKEIVKIYHGEKKAILAGENFNKVFRDKQAPIDIPVFETPRENYPILYLLCDSGLAESRNDAKRVIEGNGVTINNEKITDWRQEIKIENEMVIQFGKRKFVKIKLK